MNLKCSGLFIAGEWQEPSVGDTIAVRNPATEELLGTIPAATPREVNRAVAAANGTFGGYKQSGIGRELGIYGLEEFLELKAIQLKG